MQPGNNCVAQVCQPAAGRCGSSKGRMHLCRVMWRSAVRATAFLHCTCQPARLSAAKHAHACIAQACCPYWPSPAVRSCCPWPHRLGPRAQPSCRCRSRPAATCKSALAPASRQQQARCAHAAAQHQGTLVPSRTLFSELLADIQFAGCSRQHRHWHGAVESNQAK